VFDARVQGKSDARGGWARAVSKWNAAEDKGRHVKDHNKGHQTVENEWRHYVRVDCTMSVDLKGRRD
jgi:hypothetical protein